MVFISLTADDSSSASPRKPSKSVRSQTREVSLSSSDSPPARNQDHDQNQDQNRQIAVLAPEFGTRQANDSFLLSAFVNVWTPTQKDMFGTRPWILFCADMSDGTECALTVALRALALVRCSKLWNDDHLLERGRQTYGKALRVLQSELLDDRTKFSELVMAACRVLSTYEFLESTTDSVSGWITHVQGMERVVYLRGPARFRESLRSGALRGWRANVVCPETYLFKASSSH